MITLIFLVCMPDCIGIVHEVPYKTFQECEEVAHAIINENRENVEKGLMPDHEASFQCIGWGSEV